MAYLSAIDGAARRDRVPENELSYSLFFWPWASGVLAKAEGDKAKLLYDAFRTAGPAIQFPRSLLLDVFQTQVIMDAMLTALATGRMKWALKRRRHYGPASRAVWLIVRGTPVDEDDAFERLFDERHPSGPRPKKRRRRPRRRGRRGNPSAGQPQSPPA